MEMKWDTLLSDKRVRDFFLESRGRVQDHRTEFERDYDRAIFTTPVRRLHDKTQVFPLEPNDSVRTRLTHSLEVSTVARDMARAIGSWLEDKKVINEKQEKAIETIAATCGLIHDLGNPPFGHAGESAIVDWFRKQKLDFWDFGESFADKEQLKNDFLEFQGNAQTLRLIAKLQLLSDPYGLNFTCATMSAICKYTAPSHKLNEEYHETKKVGYFASEESLIELIRSETGTGDARNPISFIVEAADDIVYSVVDLEDGVKKRVFDWMTLKNLLKESSKGDTKLLQNCFDKAKYMIREKPGHIELIGKARDEALAQAFRVFAIGESVSAVLTTFKEKFQQIMNGDYHKELYEDSSAKMLIKACKKVGNNYVYCAENNLKLEVMARHVIHHLMDIFWEGVAERKDKSNRFANKIYGLISDNYRDVFENPRKGSEVLEQYKRVVENTSTKDKLPEKYNCMRLLTDYICGMTDTFACTSHKRLTNG